MGDLLDGERFAMLARVLALGLSRRGALTGLAALTGISLTPIDGAAKRAGRRP